VAVGSHRGLKLPEVHAELAYELGQLIDLALLSQSVARRRRIRTKGRLEAVHR
jgi:hypothetical protein